MKAQVSKHKKWLKIEFMGYGTITPPIGKDIIVVVSSEKPLDSQRGVKLSGGIAHDFIEDIVWVQADCLDIKAIQPSQSISISIEDDKKQIKWYHNPFRYFFDIMNNKSKLKKG